MKVETLALVALGSFAGLASGTSWAGWGGGILNNHWAQSNTAISSSNIDSLTEHCKIPYPQGQYSPPTVLGNYAYYPTGNGSLVALNYKTCQVKWSVNVTQIVIDYKPVSPLQNIVQNGNTITRTSPQIDVANNVIFFGTQIHALIVAVDLSTGALLGSKQVNAHELAVVTSSPTFYNGLLFVGASSNEENAAFFTGGTYQCCTFVGNAAAFRFKRTGSTGTFSTVWNVTTIPATLPKNGTQWSGAGIWGGQPSIDVGRRQVFFATGNIYSVPVEWYPCTVSNDPFCTPDYIWQESVFAVDMYTGKVNWVRRLNRLDAWTLVCGTPTLPINPALCPQTAPGTDFDFGMAPTFVPGGKFTSRGKDMLAIGQKSGVLYGLAADTGKVQWATMVGPGDAVGGMVWGLAADDKRAYFNNVNFYQNDWVLQPGNTQHTNNSIHGAASLADGSITWENATPYANMSYSIVPAVVGDLYLTGLSGPFGFGSSAPGIVLAYKKTTGQLVSQLTLEGTFEGGISIQDEYVFIGTGRGGPGFLYVFKAGH
ncbi:quinon protein alcohol dehydrogenase-like superfamily [Podospora appendiculata]|uniref:Quinon protein alcohol dehydrogenase-like superfamily n=1 Tax=Podospora appendiculata TaxID=314037 RepID=A0AAE0X8J3_9PEZI|nr:quinon protein alcohol dehydrogenase-like superfamily [Podospora appendiculata]